jgi:hypothetical protein
MRLQLAQSQQFHYRLPKVRPAERLQYRARLGLFPLLRLAGPGLERLQHRVQPERLREQARLEAVWAMPGLMGKINR